MPGMPETCRVEAVTAALSLPLVAGAAGVGAALAGMLWPSSASIAAAALVGGFALVVVACLSSSLESLPAGFHGLLVGVDVDAAAAVDVVLDDGDVDAFAVEAAWVDAEGRCADCCWRA